MQKLTRLTYTSFIAPDTDESCLSEIVRHARGKNVKLDITGFLIFDGIRFCQYLEGPGDSLFQLLDTIRADRRHLELAVKELAEDQKPRLYPDWPMALVTAHPGDAARDALINAVDAIQKFPQMPGSAIAKVIELLPTLRMETTSPTRE